MKENQLSILLVIIFLVISLSVALLINASNSPKTTSSQPPVLSAQNSTQKTQSPTPDPSPSLVPFSKTFPLDKSFTFPVKDAQGQEVGVLDYHIKQYEFTNKVMVNNVYNALLKKDKELIIFHIELTNDTAYTFKTQAGDQIRLKASDEKLLAPDISSDPVEIRPKSTAKTDIGFIVDKDNKDLVFHLGDLAGTPQSFAISREN
jgi:hypothetical protein